MIEFIKNHREVIGFILPILVLAPILMASEKSKPIRNGGVLITRYHWTVRVLGICGLALILVVLAPYLSGKAEHATATPGAAILICLLFGYLFLESNFVSVKMDDECVVAFSPFRWRRRIPIRQIRDVGYSDTLSWHVLKTDKGKVYLSDVMVGKNEFLHELEMRRKPGS